MDAFIKDEVVGDVLDTSPPEILQMKFGDVEVTPGKILTPTQVKAEPALNWTADATAFYTVMFTDPDAPTRQDQSNGEFNHWLVTNIPGSDVSKGDVMSQYVSSGPAKGTDLHRYIFLVYKQPNGRQDFPGLEVLTNRYPTFDIAPRRHWKAREFSKRFGLGEPVAGNFYQAEFDEYCLIIGEEMGFPKK